MRKILVGFMILLVLIFVGIFFYFARTSHDSSDTVIEAIERIRNQGAVEYVIHEDHMEKGVYVYYLRDMNSGSPIVSVEYIRKLRNGKWKWVTGGGHTGTQLSLVNDNNGHLPLSHQYLPIGEKKDRIPYPLIYGGISNTNIKRLVVKDYQSGLTRQVNLIDVNYKFKFYYVYVTESQGDKFDLIAYDNGNGIIYKETLEKVLVSGSAGTSIKEQP